MQTISNNRATYGWGSLTERERRVASLVAQGLTNRGVAAELYVSHHTVDAHLRQIYRKLGIDSRVVLTRLVTQRRMSVANAADGAEAGLRR
jgi:DNA-binding NarL/FixJ family response regulator